MSDRAKSSGSDQESKSEATVMEGTATQEPIARICAKPDCGAQLASANRSGRCARHFHWKGTDRSNTGKPHGSARSSGSNGHTLTPQAELESNAIARGVDAGVPDLSGKFVESRLNKLILSLSIADKAKIATAWLKGLGIFEA
jgi:hypothetical protein